MSKASTISPLEKLEKDGTADILFVMPYMKSPEATSLRHSQLDKEFWSIVRNTLPSFAAITIKQDAGKWDGERAEGKVKKYAWRITEAVSFYEAKCVVFLGQGLARLLVPDFKNSKYDIRGTFGTYRMPDLEHAHGGNIMCMAYGLPESVVGDPLECCRMSEMMAKLTMIRKGFYKKPKITNLDSYKKAKEYIDFLANEHTGLIGFDTETHSLNRVHHQRLGAMQFAHNTKEASVLLWDSKHQRMSERDLERLREPLVKLFSGDNTKFDAWVMHNGMFDTMQVHGAFGTSVEGTIIDTMVFAHLMDESRKHTARVHVDFPLALKTLVQEFLGFFWYSDEAMKARGNGTLMELPLPDFLEYSGFDPSCTLRLYHTFKQWAVFEKYDEKVLNLLRKLLSRAIGLYSDISRNGFYIDRERLITLLRKDSIINKRVSEINEAYKKFPQVRAVNTDMLADVSGVAATSFLKVPWIFDITKQKHRTALFYDSKDGFQFEPIKKPGDDIEKKSTGKEFQKLHKDNPVVALYTEAQGLCKLRDAYVRPLFEALFGNPDPNADTCDGRVHSWFHLTRTVTGRTASSNVNLQQVPRSDNPVKKAIKSLFCAAPGKVLVQADLSAAEIRTWGGLSGDDRICELSRVAFDLRRRVRENPDDLALREEAELKADFHKQTYGLCFNISPAAVTKAQRQDAKKLSFGLLYGMGDNAIAREIGKDLESALDIKKRFFNVYKQGARWLLDMQDFALKHGYVETPLGRRRRFPEVFTGEGGAIAAAKRMAVNAPVQATASDYAMLSTILLNDALKRDKVTDDVRIVNCVHDSVVLEVTATEEWLRYTAKLVRKCFTKDVVKQLGKDFGFHLKAPIDIDMDVSQWQGRKCKHCGAMQYYTDGKSCGNKLPVLDDDGKQKKDSEGNKITKKCGHSDFEAVGLNAGWGYLTALAENERSFGQAARGFTPIASHEHRVEPEKKLSRKASKRRRLAFMHA